MDELKTRVLDYLKELKIGSENKEEEQHRRAILDLPHPSPCQMEWGDWITKANRIRMSMPTMWSDLFFFVPDLDNVHRTRLNAVHENGGYVLKAGSRPQFTDFSVLWGLH